MGLQGWSFSEASWGHLDTLAIAFPLCLSRKNLGQGFLGMLTIAFSPCMLRNVLDASQLSPLATPPAVQGRSGQPGAALVVQPLVSCDAQHLRRDKQHQGPLGCPLSCSLPDLRYISDIWGIPCFTLKRWSALKRRPLGLAMERMPSGSVLGAHWVPAQPRTGEPGVRYQHLQGPLGRPSSLY